MKSLKLTLVIFHSALIAACGSDPKPPPAAPAGDSPPPAAEATPTADNPKPDDDPSKSQIRIDDAIKKACGITDAEAYFGFDSSRIQQRDHDILGKLAACFTTGPLAGRTMRLVGHADPRGEHEYNMVLGGKRAESVKGFLVQKQLPGGQIETTSRGEMDATGTDEAGWAADRRVDVVLAD
jgi:peptidoglycan-associated lipoprotein